MNPAEELLHLAKERNLEITDEAFAKYLDDNDKISHLRKQFYIPRISELLEENDVVDGPAKGSLRGYVTQLMYVLKRGGSEQGMCLFCGAVTGAAANRRQSTSGCRDGEVEEEVTISSYITND